MLENYTFITECCRHFWSMLDREGAAAPRAGSPAAEKVNKIVGKLDEYGDKLLVKKTALHSSGMCSAQCVSSSLFLYRTPQLSFLPILEHMC
jgi:hypothetical protein